MSRDDHRRYMDTVSELIEVPPSPKSLQYVLFSDTVIVNTRDEEDASLHLLLRASSHLFSALLSKQIPVRGAIAFGDFDRSIGTEQGVIVAGKPIVEAYHYEHQQDWIGIMLCPSVIRKFPEIKSLCEFPSLIETESSADYVKRLDWPLVVQFFSNIPFHSTHPLQDYESHEGYVVLPMAKSVSTARAAKLSLERAAKALEGMKAFAPDPRSHQKYARASQFLLNLALRWPLLHHWNE